MATVLDIIKRAMRLTRSLGKGEAPDADEAQDGLSAINAMLEGWRLDRLLVYAVAEDTKTLSPGTGSYTIGASGAINTPRPARIAPGSYVRLSGTDYPLTEVDASAYNAITLKSTQGVPALLYYLSGVPLGTVYLHPVPDAAYELHLFSYRLLQSFSALTDTVTLPAGYEDAVAFSLAERLAVEGYGIITPDLARMAKQARDRLIAENAPRLLMRTSDDFHAAGLYQGRSTSDITTL